VHAVILCDSVDTDEAPGRMQTNWWQHCNM